MVDTEVGREDRPPPHSGPPDGLEPGTHRQAASREGSWVQRPPFTHGLPSRQGGAVWGQREVGRSARRPGTPAWSDRRPSSLPQATAATSWGYLCGCREPPHLWFPRPPLPALAPAVGAAAVPASLSPGNHKAGSDRRRRLCQMWGLWRLPEWGVLRQEVRVPSVKGRSESVRPDPGVMEGAGAGSPGAMGLPSSDIGHLLQCGSPT